MTALKFAVNNIENDKSIIFTTSKKQDVETIFSSMIGYKYSRLNLGLKIYECQLELLSLSEISDKGLLNIFAPNKISFPLLRTPLTPLKRGEPGRRGNKILYPFSQKTFLHNP